MSGFCLYSGGTQWVKVLQEGLGYNLLQMFTMVRLLVPMNLQKVDQGISPLLDYLCINLADLIEIRCINFADPLGIEHREMWGEPSAICARMEDSRCMNTHKSKANVMLLTVCLFIHMINYLLSG